MEVVWQNSSRDPSAGMDMCLLLDGSLSVTVMGTTLKKNKSVLANNQTQSNLDNWTAILDISSRWLSAEQLMDID